MTRREKCITALVLVVNLGVGVTLLQRVDFGQLLPGEPAEPMASLEETEGAPRPLPHPTD